MGLVYGIIFIKGSLQKKKLRTFGHGAKGGGVSSAGKLFIEEMFGHVFRGSKGLVQSSFCKKKFVLRLPEELLSTFYLLQNIKK